MALTLVPATLVNSALRLGGGGALAVALAIASGAASGGLLTGRRDAWPAFCGRHVTMTLAAGGPLPVARPVRGVWLSLALVTICLAGGVVVAASRACFSLHLNGVALEFEPRTKP